MLEKNQTSHMPLLVARRRNNVPVVLWMIIFIFICHQYQGICFVAILSSYRAHLNCSRSSIVTRANILINKNDCSNMIHAPLTALNFYYLPNCCNWLRKICFWLESSMICLCLPKINNIAFGWSSSVQFTKQIHNGPLVTCTCAFHMEYLNIFLSMRFA